MRNSSDRDPLDGPTPKWEKRKSVPPEVQEGAWWWSHIPEIKSPHQVIKLASPQPPVSSSPKTQKHVSVSIGVREKVTKLTSSQSPASSPSKTQNIDRSAITWNEEHIANQILKLSDINELCTACSDPSGEKFQAFSTPLIQRLNQFIEGETINPEHVLFLLRTTLKITIPKD